MRAILLTLSCVILSVFAVTLMAEAPRVGFFRPLSAVMIPIDP
jgi:hypothetical protein